MHLPESQELKIQYLAHLFDNMSECYKLFWFQAIVNKVLEHKREFYYDELINEMAADAWYMVSEYKLNLGPADALESLVHCAYKISGMKSSEKKVKVLAFLENCEDKELIGMKNRLTLNVPYRLQAPFIKSLKGNDWKKPVKELAERINKEKHLIYYFDMIKGLKSKITIQPEWYDYIIKNAGIIQGWIQYNLVTYLQRRNPSVPGIVNKISAPQDRKLDKVKGFWKMLIDIEPVHDIYSEQLLQKTNVSIDHFVPWSYVAHDELWNLSPTTKSINSSKSNHLPEWNIYFPRLCEIEYCAYQAMWKYDAVHTEFQKIQKEHINNAEIRLKLYRKGLKKEGFSRQLEEIIYPVYHAAEEMGFQRWEL